MIGAALTTVYGVVASVAGKVTGPIFTKELRVSSRLRRNYWLRLAYVAMLTGLIVIVWVGVMMDFGHRQRSPAVRISMMSEVAKIVVAAVIWFQFCMTQLVAIVSLSTSISEEVYRRTLGVLLATPITAFQIVMGKLLSKLWQMLILIAISLPVLATVRVFGGVPWAFLIGSTCIHVTALGLYLGVLCRRTTTAVVLNIVAAVVLWVGLPWLPIGLVLLRGARAPDVVTQAWVDTNPVFQFVVVTIFASGLRNARHALDGLQYGWLHAPP